MADLKKTLGPKIRKARLQQGLTQIQVAEMIDMPVEVYGRMERGSLIPRLDRFIALCHALGASPSQLLGFPQPRSPSSGGEA